MLSRRLSLSSLAVTALAAAALVGPATAQPAQPAHPAAPAAAAAPIPLPPLFFSEGWHRDKPSHVQTEIVPNTVSNANLELKVYGLDAKDLTISGSGEPNDAMNLWSGMTTEPTGATLRDKNNYVDLSGRAKIRWTIRSSGFHVVRPLIKLADGTMLVGDRGDASPMLFNDVEFSIGDLRWVKFDPQRAVTKGGSGRTGMSAMWYENPDLTKVDEVGFVDLMPGSGHGAGGYTNVAHIWVYGVPVKR